MQGDAPRRADASPYSPLANITACSPNRQALGRAPPIFWRMKVKMILPALTEAVSPFFRPIKYALFPPLGLATLAAYLGPDDAVEIQDEHVERLLLDDTPDLVAIQVYITLRHAAYAAGWKKFEPLWDGLIRARRVGRALPILESVLEGFTRARRGAPPARSDQGRLTEGHVEAEGAGLSQGEHATGSLSAGRAMSATLLALRYRTSPAISTLPLTSSQRELSPR
jgi:hypothetical protein